MTRARFIILAMFITMNSGHLSCYATASWTSKPGQFVNIDHGLSPDKRYAIAASEDRTGKFGLFLMDSITARKIEPLEVVSEPLDTAPEAFHAEWSPDSRHVALWYRIDRSIQELSIYRIENKRAFAITGPGLLNLVAPSLAPDKLDISTSFLSLKWKGVAQFVVSSHGDIRVAEGDRATLQALGRFGQKEPAVANFVKYAVYAVCELASDDRYRVISLTPGTFL